MNTKGRTGGNGTTKEQKLTTDEVEEETTNCGKEREPNESLLTWTYT